MGSFFSPLENLSLLVECFVYMEENFVPCVFGKTLSEKKKK